MNEPKPKPKDEVDPVTEFEDKKTDEDILEYWTEERKANARPVPMPRPKREGGGVAPEDGG